MNVIQPNKTTLKFAEENAFFFTPLSGFSKINLYDYQKDLLNTFDNDRLIMVRHSRQMGISTLIKLYLANTMLNTYEKPKKIMFLTPKYYSGCDVLEEVKRLIKQSQLNKIIIDNKRNLEMRNGNKIILANSHLDSFRGHNLDEIVIDNCNFIDKLEGMIDAAACNLSNTTNGKIILISSNSKNNTFFKKLFGDESNQFIKKRISWDLHPNRGKEWYGEMSRHLSKEELEIELDLIDYVELEEPTKKTISLRIDSNLLNKISLKLLDKDINLSEYVRNLIEKDLR